jgi:hypothetical protein
MDLPLLLSSTPICLTLGLTADLKMRYGSDIHLVSERVSEISKTLIISIYHNLSSKWDDSKKHKI